MRNHALAVLLSVPLYSMAQVPSVCSLLSAKDIAAVLSAAVGKLAPEEAATLTKQQFPALPTTIKVEQCAGAIRPSGAVTVRIGLLTAERDLSQAEWQRAAKALDEPSEKASHATSQNIAGSTCWRHSWSTKQQLHESTCSRTKGRWHLTVSLEHEDAAKLPTVQVVSELLAKAAAALPTR
jgi:hypothetical protein